MSTASSLLDREWSLRYPHAALLGACLLAVLAAGSGIWSATSVCSVPHFVLLAFFLIYLPGKLVLDAARVHLDPLEELSLALVLGMMASSLLYYLCALLGIEVVFFVWPTLSALVGGYRGRNTWRRRWRGRVTVGAPHLFLVLVLVACLLPLLALPMYYRNLALLPQDSMSFLRKPNDAIFHLSIAQELTHSIPPQAPFLAGRPLGYHYGMDLLVAMFARTAGLSVLDLTARFVPTLLLVMAVLAVFTFCRRWLGSGSWAALCTFLVMLGEEFSFVPGVLLGSDEVWSWQFFGVPTTSSLYFMNPMLPALGVLFAGLFCLAQYWKGGGRVWPFLTAFLFAGLLEYKIFAVAHVVGILGLAGLVYFVLFRDQRPWRAAALTLVLAVPLLTHSLLVGQGAARVWTRVDPWPYIPEMLEQLGLSSTALGHTVTGLFQGGPNTVTGWVALLVVGLPAYLLGSLGVRVLGIPGVLKGMLRPQREEGMRFFLALFCSVGPLATLILTVTPSGYAPESEYNNAVWFFVQSKYVVWLFVMEVVMLWLAHRRGVGKVVCVAAIVALSIPSTLQYFQRQLSYQPTVLESQELDLVEFLRGRCSKGQVVVTRQAAGEYVVSLTTCRVPVLKLGIYTHSFAPQEELAQRQSDHDEFWDSWNQGELRADVVQRYEVNYVIVDKRAGDAVLNSGSISFGRGTDSSQALSLSRIFENEHFVVYSVSEEDGPAA
jgi:hypothetical protein